MKANDIFHHFLSRADWVDRETMADRIWYEDPEKEVGSGWSGDLCCGASAGLRVSPKDSRQSSRTRLRWGWARGLDGGGSWNTWVPKNYAGGTGDLREHRDPMDFSSPGFVMRVEGAGYHGIGGARWFCSEN